MHIDAECGWSTASHVDRTVRGRDLSESKNRRLAYRQAKQSLMLDLTGDEAVVADTAIKLFERFVFPNRYTGGCYLVTMFLH